MNDQTSTTESSKPPPLPKKQLLSSTSSSSPVLVATPTSLDDELNDTAIMDDNGESKAAAVTKKDTISSAQPTLADTGEKDAKSSLASKSKGKAKTGKKVERKGKKSTKKSKKEESSEENGSDGISNEDESSEDEREIKRREKRVAAKVAEKKKAAKLKVKEKAKKMKKKGEKSKKYDSSDDFSESELESESEADLDLESSEDEKVTRKKKAKAKAKGKKKVIKKYESSGSESSASSSSPLDSSSSEDEKVKRKRSKKKAKKAKVYESSSPSEAEEETTAETTPADDLDTQIAALQVQKQQLLAAAAALKTQTDAASVTAAATTDKKTASKKGKKNSLEFKRVDQVWDSKIRDYKYTESVEEQKDEFDSVFTVRRRFGWDNKYIETQVDIKSKVLRNALQVIFKDCKSISLVEDKPSIQPNMLYHYYKEIHDYVKKTLTPSLQKAKKHKERTRISQQISQCKLLLRYIDEDYHETRKTLKPMLKAGTIPYNLVWALFKPNTIAYTPTYGNKDDPRCFKVDYCYEEEDWFGNKKWTIEGRYLEYDGKVFGLGDHFVQIAAFKGHRKISGLGAYPLAFHKEPEALRQRLVERGKKFVALQGMNYRVQKGLAYMKVKRTVMKFIINGRVMIDPALFRRMNANYPLSYIKADELGQDDDEDDDDEGSDCGCGDGSDSDGGGDDDEDQDEAKTKGRVVMWKDKAGKKYLIRLPSSDKGPDITTQKLDTIAEAEDTETDTIKHVFSEEELLIASPVVLGFSFSEKAWVEFSLSGIREIEWNDEAFDTLVLPTQIKQNLKGLVSSHRFDAAKTIDDVIVGKGKGLNVVLHGPPGVGKTLTGESIAEYLRCPLYAVSSGELGTNAAQLERDLNRIMDITHSWGAILLLDEADVFLEARQPHDIHRNALVSVFLRMTEYYQGILFLTTNRVATFDEAFQSRIHMGIRYEDLSVRARKIIWQHYVGKVVEMAEGVGRGVVGFGDEEFDVLAAKVLNGRQIKNAVKTSQAIAIAENRVFGMEYVKRVMDAHESFEEDMMGGSGYRDAMRLYT